MDAEGASRPLRVIVPDVGGGFGSKIFHYPEEALVCGRLAGSAAR